MRLLLVSDLYHPFIGGSELETQFIARSLVAEGHDVTVVTLWQSGLLEKTIEHGVRIHRLRALSTALPWFSTSSHRRFHPPFPDPCVVVGLRRLIAVAKPDLVHASGWIAYSCAAALVGMRVPFLLSVRDQGYVCATRLRLHLGKVCSGPNTRKCLKCARERYGFVKSAAAVAGLRLFRGLLLRETSMIHVPSSYMGAIVQRELLVHGPNGMIDVRVIPGFRSEWDQGEFSGDLQGLLPAEPYILFVGALQKHKGIGQLLEAYTRLNPRPPLVMIGTVHPDSPRNFPAGVTVLRNLPNHQVMKAWDASLFGVAPSIIPESFGNIIHEGMSRGKAVIASAVGGPTDIIVPEVSGILVPPGDVAALREAMQRLVDDRELREAFGKAAKIRSQLYTRTAVMPRFIATYTELSERRRQGKSRTGQV